MYVYYLQHANGATHHFNRNEENIMAYSLLVKMGAAYVGAIALMTVATTLLA